MLADHYAPIDAPTPRGCRARSRFGGACVWLAAVGSDCEGDVDLEARLRSLTRLRHPGLAPLIDFGTADESPELGLSSGQTFLVLEAAGDGRGVGLEALEPDALLATTAQLLSALEHLHANQQLFGDMTPAHVGLTLREGSLPRAQLLGLAGIRRTSSAESAAPERREGKPATRSSDLYSLGAVVASALGDREGGAASALRPVLRRLTHASPDSRTANAGEALQELLEWHPESVRSLQGELRETRLIGRDALLEDLGVALEGALLDAPRQPLHWVQLVGEPGSGRSRLIVEAASRLRLQGVACTELAGLEPGAIAKRGEEILELAARGPVMAYLRDLDRASADAQVAALRLVKQAAGAGLPLVVVLTLDSDPSGSFAKELEKAAALSTPHLISVGALDREALGSLIGAALGVASVPPALLALTHGWCGGNPGLARLALARLLEAGALEHDGRTTHVHTDRLGSVPGGPAPALEAVSPSGLKRDSRRLLRALSVAAGPVRLALLESICGLGASPFQSALTPLLEREIVERSGEGDDARLGFRRALVKETTRAGQTKRERDLLHRAFLGALEPTAKGRALDDLEDDLVDTLAHHALELGERKAATRFVPEAARRDRSSGAPRRAAQRLGELFARDLASKLPADRRVELLGALGDAQQAAGEPEAAEAAYAQALATRSPKVSPVERVRLHRLRAGACLKANNPLGGRESLKRARELLDAVDPKDEEWRTEQVRLTGLEANEAHSAGRHRDVLTITGRLLRELGEDPASPKGTQASMWNTRGLARFYLGDYPRARKLLRKSLHLCREISHQAGISVSLGNLGIVAWSAGDIPRASKLQRQSGRVAKRAGLAAQTGKALHNLGNIANAEGRLLAARSRYRKSLAIATRIGDDGSTSLSLSSLGDSHLGAADPARAVPYFKRAAAVGEASALPYALALAKVNLAHAAVLQGRYALAQKRLQEGIDLRRELDGPERLARALALAARLELRLGRSELAAPLLAEAQQVLATDETPIARGEVAYARAEQLVAAGNGEGAREQLTLSRAAFGEGHYRGGQALARCLAARLLVNEGRRDDALAEVRLAEAEAQACGAEGLAAEARVLRADAELLAEAVDPGLVEAALDRVRRARSFGLERGLPELVRAASGTLGRLLARLGRTEEARAEQLAARKAVEQVTKGLPGSLAKGYRARPDVARDIEAPQAKPVPLEPSAAEAPPQARTPTSSEQLTHCLQAVLTLFQARVAYALRREGATFVAVGSQGSEGDDDPASELGGEVLAAAQKAPHAGAFADAALGAHCLAAPVGGKRGVLLMVRDVAAFTEQELALATNFAAALTPWLRPAKPEPSGPKVQGRRRQERYGLLGRSEAIKRALEQIERFAPFRMAVLIHGESGTGKELTARALHHAGPRRDGPFVALNAGALSESLVAVELFGATAGAYTGAEERPGLFELADGGTLFLDEVADTPLSVQAMLLRVLEEQKVRRVGSPVSRPVDVRIVSASNQDLRALVRDGSFREDLFYRLGGLTIELPALRARPGDAQLLAKRFLRDARREGRTELERFSAGALEAIGRHAWPGNVRELRNAVERALALHRGGLQLEPEDLGLTSASLGGSALPASGGGSLAELEREAIVTALAAHPTLTAAARALGIDRRTLRRRMKRHGVVRPV